MPDRAVLRFRQQDPVVGSVADHELGQVTLPRFRGPDLPHFQLHLSRMLAMQGLHPVRWEGGVRHDKKNSPGETGSGDVWELGITLALSGREEQSGGLLPALALGVLPKLYARFIPPQRSHEEGGIERAQRAARASLERQEGWMPGEVQDLPVLELSGGDYLFGFQQAATGTQLFLVISSAGQAQGRLQAASLGAALPLGPAAL